MIRILIPTSKLMIVGSCWQWAAFGMKQKFVICEENKVDGLIVGLKLFLAGFLESPNTKKQRLKYVIWTHETLNVHFLKFRTTSMCPNNSLKCPSYWYFTSGTALRVMKVWRYCNAMATMQKETILCLEWQDNWAKKPASKEMPGSVTVGARIVLSKPRTNGLKASNDKQHTIVAIHPCKWQVKQTFFLRRRVPLQTKSNIIVFVVFVLNF